MLDIGKDNWELMAQFSNAVTDIINQFCLTPPEIIIVLEMISIRLKQLLEVKKAG
jgi:hypothetical protein